MLSLELRDAFEKYADTLEILGDNPFRIRSYRRVAQTILEVSEHDLHTFGEKELEALPGIGEGIAKKIIEYRETGKITKFEDGFRQIPAGLFELLKIPGMGPKSVSHMWKKLGVTGFEDLNRVIEKGELTKLFGFGEKKVAHLRESLHLVKKSEDRIPYHEAKKIADRLLEYMKRCPTAEAVEIAGSLRRKKATVGDIDILVKSTSPQQVISYFTALPEVIDTLARGSTKASVRIADSGRQVDLRVLPPESFGSALQYFTGNKEHNVELRQLAQKQGLKLSEYGLFRGSEKIAGETEAGVYDALNVRMPPPELRLGQGEIPPL